MRLPILLAWLMYSLSLEAVDTFLHLPGMTQEKEAKQTECSILYVALQTFLEDTTDQEKIALLNTDTFGIKDILTENDAEMLYELLKPYYAHFFYKEPTSKSSGILVMSKCSLDKIHEYLRCYTKSEETEEAQACQETSHSSSYRRRESSTLKENESIMLCGDQDTQPKNRVGVEGSSEKSNTGESETKGSVQYERELKNGGKAGVGVGGSVKKDGQGKKTKTVEGKAFIDF